MALRMRLLVLPVIALVAAVASTHVRLRNPSNGA